MIMSDKYLYLVQATKLLEFGKLSEADKYFEQSLGISFNKMNSIMRVSCMHKFLLWVKLINSASAQYQVRQNKKYIKLYNPIELSLYIQIMKIKYLYFLIKPLEALNELKNIFRK